MEGKDKLIYIYGINPVVEALKIPFAVRELLISKNRVSKLKEIINLAEKNSISVKIVDETYIEKFSSGVHQGVIAKVKPKKNISLQEALKIPEMKAQPPFFLIVDLIEDPQNFGSILRIADCAGIHAVVYQQKRSVGLVPSVWKASSGAVWHVNLVDMNNIKYAIKEFKNYGIKIIGAEASGEKIFWDADFKKPLAIVVGSEGKGLRHTVKQMCDEIIKIPMKGHVNSLNVSVATGILLFEVIRQRSLSCQ